MNEPIPEKLDLRGAFEEGRARPLVIEKRSNRHGWTPLRDLHEQERTDVNRLLKLVPYGTRGVHVGIKPDTGQVGVFVVVDLDPELDLNSGGVIAADPGTRAQETSNLVGAQIASALGAAGAVLEKLSAGIQLSYEDVFDSLPSNIPTETVRAALLQGTRTPVDISVGDRDETLGGYSCAIRELVTRHPIELLVDVREINRDGRPNGTVKLEVVSAADPSKRLIAGLAIGKTLEAQLRTADNQRALSLLHLPGAFDVYVRVRIGATLNLTNGRTSFVVEHVEDMDSEKLVGKMRPIQYGIALADDAKSRAVA